MKIYGDVISGNCLKIKYLADHLDLPYDWVEIDILKGESRTPDFLAMNPMGQVPTVVLDDGRTLAQSNAVLLYLAEGSALLHGRDYILPDDLKALAMPVLAHRVFLKGGGDAGEPLARILESVPVVL